MTGQELRSTFIDAVRKADAKDDIIFTFLFDQGVGLLQLSLSYPVIADLLGISAPIVTLWRSGVNLPSEAMMRREIMEKLVVSLM